MEGHEKPGLFPRKPGQEREPMFIFFDGRWVRPFEAKVSVTSHALHYATSIITGIRVVKREDGTFVVFRLKDHLRRLFDSCKIHNIELPYSMTEFEEIVREMILRNITDDDYPNYLRILVFLGEGKLGVDGLKSPVSVAGIPLYWGAYLGPDSLSKGVTLCTSTWRRPNNSSVPLLAKASPNYVGHLAKEEAVIRGFTEAIQLNEQGYISECPGANIFFLWEGKIWTPSLSSNILWGITRDTLIEMFQHRDIKVREEQLPRELLYIADEIWVCGSATFSVGVTKVDHQVIGNGTPGMWAQWTYQELVNFIDGRVSELHGRLPKEWLYTITV